MHLRLRIDFFAESVFISFDFKKVKRFKDLYQIVFLSYSLYKKDAVLLFNR
jgi:hypothetical protein